VASLLCWTAAAAAASRLRVAGTALLLRQVPGQSPGDLLSARPALLLLLLLL
jgi:hypothetical protein